MAVFKMSFQQLAFPAPSFMDNATPPNPVPLDGLTLTYDSADESIVKWENRMPDGTADPAGAMAAVAQGPLGAVQIHLTATNPDGTTVVLAQDMEITGGDAITGTMNFGPVVNKP